MSWKRRLCKLVLKVYVGPTSTTTNPSLIRVSQDLVCSSSSTKPSEAWGCAKFRVFPSITCCITVVIVVREIGIPGTVPALLTCTKSLRRRNEYYNKSESYSSESRFGLQQGVYRNSQCSSSQPSSRLRPEGAQKSGSSQSLVVVIVVLQYGRSVPGTSYQ
jgi:hypothetical protein